MRLLDYKKEILSGILGALLTAVFSLTVGLYNLNRSFELSLKKDLLYGLKTDITLLRNVDRELDENLNLLLNNNFKISIDTEEVTLPPFPFDKEEDEEAGKKMSEMINQYLIHIRGRLFKVSKIEGPTEKFIADAWQPAGPTVSNIDFELIQKLNDLYRKIIRVNKYIDGSKEISSGMILFEPNVNKLKTSVPEYNDSIGEITQNTVLNLKNEITKEINRLQEEYSQIVF